MSSSHWHFFLNTLRGRPQRTSAIFRGGGGTQLQTFADMRGGGVLGMQTSAFLEKVLEGLRSQKNFIFQNSQIKVQTINSNLLL